MKNSTQFALFLFLLTFGTISAQIPSNDECATPVVISGLNVLTTTNISVDLGQATETAPQLLTNCETNASYTYYDVWYEFTMPVDGNVEFTNVSSTESLTLYDGCSGTELDCEFNDGYFYNLTMGITYVLRFAERDTNANISSFDIIAHEQIANDECADRIAITIPSGAGDAPLLVAANFRNASPSSPGLTTVCETNASFDYHDVWYEFVMPVDGNIHMTSAIGSESFTLYDSCGGVELECRFDDGFFYDLTQGTTYVLRFAERVLFANASDFEIKAYPTIANDECIDRIPITVPSGVGDAPLLIAADLRNATPSLPALTTVCETNASFDYHDVWYEIVMPVDGNIHLTSAVGSESFTLYDSCGGVELECRFDDGFFYDLTQGTTYILRFAERALFANASDFEIKAYPTIANDECADRIAITVPSGVGDAPLLVAADLRNASPSSPALTTVCETNASFDYHDVWYEFVMPVDGNVQLTSVPGSESFTLYDSCGGVELDCRFDDGYFYDLTQGTTYVLRYAERALFANASDFEIKAYPTIANDECVDRIAITVPSGVGDAPLLVAADFRNATPSSPSLTTVCETNASLDYHDVWYEFVMPVDGNIHFTSVPGSESFTLYDSCGGVELDCRFDDGYFYDLTQGTTYVLRYAERALFADASDFEIKAYPTIVNDACADAVTAVIGTVAAAITEVDFRSATPVSETTCENNALNYHDAWYEVTMPFDGDLQIQSLPSSMSASLFDSCGGTELACFFNDGTFFSLSAGTTYILRVAERALFAADRSFGLLAIEAPLAACASTVEFIGGSWTPGPPDITTNAIIRSNYNTATAGLGSFSACSVAIDSGVILTVGADDYLEVGFDINVPPTASLVVEHTGTVVQRDGSAVTTNNGTVEVEVTTPFLEPRDLMIMGSPLDAETRDGVYTNAFLVLKHFTTDFVPNPDVAAAFPLAENFADDDGNNWKERLVGNADPMNAGEGFVVRPQASYTDGNTTYDLVYDEGTLNNGDISFPVLFNTTKNDSPNFLGNPYPSAISADDFINGNTMVDEIYFWEHLTPPSAGLPGAYAMNFSMEDLSMYNLSGGIAAASDPTGAATAPNGFISTAQGFAIKANAAGTAVFTNSMRRLSNNNTLRRPEAPKNRLWLTLENEEYDLQNTTLIGFFDQTTEGIDVGYDSRRLATTLSIFSEISTGEEFGIQAREAFDPAIKIPVGFSSLLDIETSYRISLANIEGDVLPSAKVFLYDNMLGLLTELTAQPYEFTAEKGTFKSRFTLAFEAESLSVTTNTFDTVRLFPNPGRNNITVSAGGNQSIVGIEIFDLTGRKVLEQEFNNLGSIRSIDISGLDSASYLMQVKGISGTRTLRFIRE